MSEHSPMEESELGDNQHEQSSSEALATPTFAESDELRLKRYEELYKLTSAGVKSEIERYRLLDEKASKYFTALNILLAVVAFASKEAMEYILPASQFVDYAALVLAGSSILLLLLSLGYMVRVITLRDEGLLKEAPSTDEVVELFHEKDYVTAIFAMSRSNVRTYEANIEATRLKSVVLSRGAKVLVLAIIFFGTFIGVFSARLWLDTNKPIMKENTHQSATSGSSSQQDASSAKQSNKVPLPDTSVRPPKSVTVSEGAHPAPKRERQAQ